MREHAVLNVCGVIITTNNKDSLHLPADDRRHFVAWSTRNKEDFPPDYWKAIYRWFASGGIEIVAHHLATLDISGFDPKAPPPKTPAFWEIVDLVRSPEDAEMADALARLGSPSALTLGSIVTRATPDFADYLRDRRNRRKIPHRLDECGYVPVRNSTANGHSRKVFNAGQAPPSASNQKHYTFNRDPGRFRCLLSNCDWRPFRLPSRCLPQPRLHHRPKQIRAFRQALRQRIRRLRGVFRGWRVDHGDNAVLRECLKANWR